MVRVSRAWRVEHLGAVQHARQRDQHFLQIDFGFDLLARSARVARHNARKTSRSRRGTASSCSAAILKRSYSCRRCGSAARADRPRLRGRSYSRGSNMRDLISASSAAITRYSAARSHCSARHQLDVLHVLARDLGDLDVEDIEVLRGGSDTAADRAVPRTFRGILRAHPAGCTDRSGSLRDRLTADDRIELIGLPLCCSRSWRRPFARYARRVRR